MFVYLSGFLWLIMACLSSHLPARDTQFLRKTEGKEMRCLLPKALSPRANVPSFQLPSPSTISAQFGRFTPLLSRNGVK